MRCLHHGPPDDEDAPVFGRRVEVARGDTAMLHCHSTLSFYTAVDLSLTVIDCHSFHVHSNLAAVTVTSCRNDSVALARSEELLEEQLQRMCRACCDQLDTVARWDKGVWLRIEPPPDWGD